MRAVTRVKQHFQTGRRWDPVDRRGLTSTTGAHLQDLTDAIYAAAKAKVSAHESRHRRARDETVRRNRRSTVTNPRLKVRRPEIWDFHPGFNPYKVRSNAPTIAYSIGTAIKEGRYLPLAPAGFLVPKNGSTPRTVTAFAIADEVVSKRLYSSLIAKNRPRLSAHSYAYRRDIGVHDAIAYIDSEWRAEHRIYVAQYDFSDYFGSIDHDHVWSTIGSLELSITRTEKKLVKAFMEAPMPTLAPGEYPLSTRRRERGVHQGTTSSLLIANIAATPLDRAFERLGVSFVRYADDIVIWSRDYGNISRAVDELHRFAEKSGCDINHAKSEGISLLTRKSAGRGEFRTMKSGTFLSHDISLSEISISDKSLASAKETIESFIYNNLLREPMAGTQDLRRLHTGLDRDYIALIWQLRHYLYGSLNEEQLRRLLRGPLPPRIKMGGLIGRHPLVNDKTQLREFDVWLSTQVWLALRKRESLLGSKIGPTPKPWGFRRHELMTFATTSSTTGDPVDGRLPSAVRMSELVRRGVRAHGNSVATFHKSLYRWG